MTNEAQKKLDFILNSLPNLILQRREELRDHTVVKCTGEAVSSLDGFMSAIYSVELILKDQDGK